jgi:hypothetical protein
VFSLHNHHVVKKNVYRHHYVLILKESKRKEKNDLNYFIEGVIYSILSGSRQGKKHGGVRFVGTAENTEASAQQ